MLSARIHLILLPVFILIRTLDLLRGKIANKKKASLWAAGIIISMVTLMAVLPGTSRRLTDLKNEWRSIDGMVDGKQTNHRVYLWKYGWNIANESPIIGVGNGAGDELLHEALQSCDAVFYKKKSRITSTNSNTIFTISFCRILQKVGLLEFSYCFFYLPWDSCSLKDPGVMLGHCFSAQE